MYSVKQYIYIYIYVCKYIYIYVCKYIIMQNLELKNSRKIIN